MYKLTTQKLLLPYYQTYLKNTKKIKEIPEDGLDDKGNLLPIERIHNKLLVKNGKKKTLNNKNVKRIWKDPLCKIPIQVYLHGLQ